MMYERQSQTRWLLTVLCLSCATAQNYANQYKRQSTGAQAAWAFLGTVVLSLSIFACWYCWRQVFPRNNDFLALDLDEIRLERIDERETMLTNQLKGIQNKLTSYRRKKTEIQVRRDVTKKLEENLDRYNDKGTAIYGDQWHAGEVPINEMMGLPDQEIRQLQIEAQNIVTQRKAEEERDLWHLWNGAKASGGGKTDKKTDVESGVGAEMRGADVMTDRLPTGRKTQAKSIGAAAVAAGRTARSSENASGDPRFSSAPIAPSGRDNDDYANYKGKKGSASSAKTPPLDLSKISFPPSGIQRPGAGGGGGGGKGTVSSAATGLRANAGEGGDSSYNIELGINASPASKPTGGGRSSGSSPAPRRTPAGGSLPPIARRPAPPPINPMHSDSSPLQRLDQTHAAFSSGGAGQVWGAQTAMSSPSSPALQPPPGVRAPQINASPRAPPRGPAGHGPRAPPRGPRPPPGGFQLARPGGRGAPPRGPRAPPPRAPAAPSPMGSPLRPPPGIKGPPPRIFHAP